MSRCNTILAAALAAAALAAPNALAQTPDIHAGLSEPAPERQSKQDLRMPDTRDAARAATPSDHNDARPETAGNPNVSADAAPSAQAITAAEDRALAQERHHSSYGRSAPLVRPAGAKANYDSPWPTIALAAVLFGVAAVSAVAVARSAARDRVAA
jgi:hypothetical protein